MDRMNYYIELISKQQNKKVKQNMIVSLVSFLCLMLYLLAPIYLIINYNPTSNYYTSLTICIIGFVILLGMWIYTIIDTFKSISKYKKIISKLEKE